MKGAVKTRKFEANTISDIGTQNGNKLNYEDLEEIACHPSGNVA